MTRKAKSAGEHPLSSVTLKTQTGRREFQDKGFHWFCILTAAVSLVILALLLGSVLWQGVSHLSPNFLTHYPEANAALAGVGPAIGGTIWVCAICGLMSLPIGVATAIFLEEFQPTSFPGRKIHSIIQLNITNLAGVPSVVYGILGLTLFVTMSGWFGGTNNPAFEFGGKYYDQFFTAGGKVLLLPVDDPAQPVAVVEPGMRAMTSAGEWVDVTVAENRRALPVDPAAREHALIQGREAGRILKPSWYYFRLPFGRSVLAGALTLMLVVLPVIIISSQEALRAVPGSLREAGLGLAATRWQVVRNVTLPAAIPGIMTGAILAMSRAIGEAAPILILAGAIFITASPGNLMDGFTVLPLQIYDWAGRPQHEFHDLAAAGIVVLLAILFAFNLVAVLVRQFTQKPLA